MLKRFFQFFLSVKLASLLLLVFAAVIGVATFIENDFGRITAKALIYSKWWFELILFMLLINLIYNLKRYNLFRKEKLAVLTFHMAFIIILIGSAITRYHSFEGMMHIREGEESNIIVSDDTFLQVRVDNRKLQLDYDKKLYLSGISNNNFSIPLDFLDNKISIEYVDFLPNVRDTFLQSENGVQTLHLVVPGDNGMQSEYLKINEQRKIKNNVFAFNNMSDFAINIYYKDSILYCKAPFEVQYMKMSDRSSDSFSANTEFVLSQRTLYSVNDLNFVLKDIIENGNDDIYSSSNVMSDGSTDALKVKINCNEESKEVILYGGKGFTSNLKEYKVGGLYFNISYGSKNYYTPFSIKLRDFQLERYPGSMSPSSFAAEVTVKDGKLNEDHRIFMNTVLDYRGYRFFQSSYDQDELGTILSVNHDLLGTLVSYLGYFLLALGMITVFFTSKTRFAFLNKQLNKIKSKVALLTAALFLSINVTADTNLDSLLNANIINVEHIKNFEKLLIQDNGGRIKPVNTICSEFLRKIARKNKIAEQNPTQIVVGMMKNPKLWSNVPMIKISHDKLKLLLQTEESRVSFRTFFSEDGDYILKDEVDRVNSKVPIDRDKYDKDIITVDERINICFTIYNGDIFRFFPLANDSNNTWYTASDNSFFSNKDSLFVTNIMLMYMNSLNRALTDNNWATCDSVVSYISKFQIRYGEKIIPKDYKVELEVLYNKLNIFSNLFMYYFMIGFIFLIILIVRIFKNNALDRLLKFIFFLILFGFLVQTLGLASRWVISGHAPWSNGYESMIYISWATMLSGIIFSLRSKLTLAATTLVTSLFLMVAHLNWLDPEITNIVPVLNSYWLMIHVSIITASYGFLALGAVLGLFSLWLIIFTNTKTKNKILVTIKELTLINEKSITIGLFMLTIGTFLGGVWANESWGRYWGWDPKETWALVSVLIYAFVLHMRLIPALSSFYTFNLATLVAIWSIIMTYFGVNYYLSGLHSYAAGDPMPIPSFVYYLIVITFITAILARNKYKRYY
ncbi:cytochrome c biogenesis protein CcsA [Flavobacteriales bacterium]|nr:cytochrome c biogenesis protein CcsA [Flavobacteriales bacterium]